MAELYKQWNARACAVTIPKAFVQSSKSSVLEELSAEIAGLLDPATLRTVQATSNRRFVLEFSNLSTAAEVMRNGIGFRGVHLTPTVAYYKLTSVFVKRAPFGVPDDEFVKALSPYGRVVSVKPLTLKKFPKIFTGTRLVRMAVEKTIPCFMRVMDFPVLVRYRGQPFQCYRCRQIGHSYKECPDKDIPSARRHVTKPPPSSPISGPHASKFPMEPTPLVVTGCQPAGTTSKSVIPPATAVIPSTAQPSPMEVVPPSSSDPSSSVDSPLVTLDIGAQSTVGDLSGSPAVADSNVTKEEPKYNSVATWTGPSDPIVSVRVWFRKNHTQAQRHVVLSMEDLLISLKAAYKEEAARGFCFIHWQLMTKADAPIQPRCTKAYDLEGETLMVRTTKHLGVTEKQQHLLYAQKAVYNGLLTMNLMLCVHHKMEKIS
ncbi:zinc finger CCHC domain-containing 3-like [Paramuricea clavata]|uniref:Zinc finger CCHC domain-containing 3-like n=1 Tax=Paramuricea clavata TaxID=317549 RepID=A0A6S7KUN5_PARCT|nr:zinc finger CCHC domain-containing 3-like [Paramuricea clavata]